MNVQHRLLPLERVKREEVVIVVVDAYCGSGEELGTKLGQPAGEVDGATRSSGPAAKLVNRKQKRRFRGAIGWP
jgi:hypothetical protein